MITSKQYKALKIVQEKGRNANNRTVRAYEFALAMWGSQLEKAHLFTAVSNQGNGACAGKKAWLCGGSYLGRLVKLGYLSRMGFFYYINRKGEQAIKEYELVKGISQ